MSGVVDDDTKSMCSEASSIPPADPAGIDSDDNLKEDLLTQAGNWFKKFPFYQYSNDNTRLYVHNRDGKLCVLEFGENVDWKKFEPFQDLCTNTIILVSGHERIAIVWDADTLKEVSRVIYKWNGPLTCEVSKSGMHLRIRNQDGTSITIYKKKSIIIIFLRQ